VSAPPSSAPGAWPAGKFEPKAVSLAEIAEAERTHGKRIIAKVGQTSYGIYVYFVAPVMLTSLFAVATATLRNPATAVCLGAIPFAVIRWIVIPLMRRHRVLRSHSEDLTSN
jgi:hypothetical protein